MFRGLSAVNIDSKGRVSIPSRYRDQIVTESDGQMVITVDTEEKCLLLYTQNQWEPIEKKLQQLPSFEPAVRRIQRLLIGHATEVDMDNVGRILLPQALRQYANLSKKILLVGQGNKFEVWDESYWEDMRVHWLEKSAAHHSEVLKEIAL